MHSVFCIATVKNSLYKIADKYELKFEYPKGVLKLEAA